MIKKLESIILSILLLYSVYCSLTVGASWDEFYHHKNGQNIFSYIFSLGTREYNSANFIYHYGLYDFLSVFFTKNFSQTFIVEAHHIFNLIFSFGSLFGIYQVSKYFLNKNIGKIAFLLCFFNPVYFGHFSINPKDTIISFCYIWIFYYGMRYYKKFENLKKKKSYILILILLLSLGLSIRLTFIFSLIPIILILFFEFYISDKTNKFKILFIDILKIIFFSFIITIIFWPDTHHNLLTDPFVSIVEYFKDFLNSNFGLTHGLINGKIYEVENTPFYYYFLLLIYKMPIYIVITFLISPLIIFFNFNKLQIKAKNIYYLIFNIFFLFLILIILQPGINDGLRYFLYIIPFIIIISSLSLYVIFRWFNSIVKFFFVFLFIYNLLIFFILSPYQYIFINNLNGKFKNNLNMYEIDYWGISLKELIKNLVKADILNDKDKNYKIATCGLNQEIVEFYLKKYSSNKFKFVSLIENYDYIIMVNRVDTKDNIKFETCFNNHFKKEIISVKRNDLQISIVSN